MSYLRILLLGSCLLTQVAVNAQPLLETGPKKPMPDEWIDRDTHHKIVRLSRKEGNNGSFYFHNNPFIGNKMVFYSTDTKGKQIYTVDLGTLEISSVTDQPSPMGGEIAAVGSRRVFYQIKDSVFATNIDNRRTELLFVFPADFKGSVATLNADETLLAGVQSGDGANEILKKYPEKRDFFNRIYEAHIPHTLFTIDLRTKELKKIHRESTWIGHVQFSPTDPALLMFCHEGPWQKVDRIWTINVRTDAVKLMHKRTVDNEIAGHEFFSPDGKSIWFDWQIPKGETFYLGKADLATGAEKKISMTRNEWSIHFATSPDQAIFAGDGGDSGQVAHAKDGRWIYLFRPEGDRFVSERLVNMKDQYYKLEPNVHFSPDGKWVIFRGNFEGKEEVYGVEIQTAVSQLAWPAITAQTRPWTRWWWMGSAVNRQDLAANMEKYKEAGLGGLELTPIYGVKGYESQFLSYLSPEWMDRLSYTLEEARRLGLGLDMSTGTGWPFGGGPLIDSTYACKNFVYKSWPVKAGMVLPDTVHFLQEALVHTDGMLRPAIGQLVEPVFANKDLQSLALFQVRFEKWLPLQSLMGYSTEGKILDLTTKVDAEGHLQWVAPAGGGDWMLYAIFQGWHGKMVERAAPGAEGNVIDHFSSAALQKYLSRFDTAFAGRKVLGLRAFFNDSYEVDDARGQSNWTPGFFELFRQYRGYDLREHLPALFGKDIKENNERVLCDYRETISDLLLDKFTRGWRAWAQGKGAIIRNQAHGSPANILDLYGASDIPETEGADIYRYKFATSVAHTTGKKLASSESVTWLNEHFLSTLSDVKKSLDNYLLGGVNHIFYHGTAYTPPADPWPGWLFYASVHFTPNDPSWGNMGTLNQYVARCQSFLQEGASDNDVLLYYPVYDSWSDPGSNLLKHYDRMEPEFNGTGFKESAEILQRMGYAYDYISDKQVQQTTVGTGGAGALVREPGNEMNGRMKKIRTSGGGLYQTVLLPDCRYVSVEALEKLIGLAEGGATILVYKELPSDVPGWGALHTRRNAFEQLRGRLHFVALGEGVQRAAIGKGAFMMGNDLAGLLAAAKIRRERMAGDSLEFVRRVYGQGSYYFIVNKRGQSWEGFVSLAGDFTDAAVFNPMDGRSGRAKLDAKGRRVYLQLLPGESVIVETSAAAITSTLYPYYRMLGKPVEIKGVWKLDFVEGGPGLPVSVRVDQLGSWTALDGEAVKNFSGTGKYTIRFERPATPVMISTPGGAAMPGEAATPGSADYSLTGLANPNPSGKVRGWMLDLGKVDATAQVFLNGNKLATLIGPYYRVLIPAEDMLSKNELEIRVSNGMANRIEDMDRKGVPWKKFYNYNFPAHVRENRNASGLFDASSWKPFDSGLSGPVTLTAVDTLAK